MSEIKDLKRKVLSVLERYPASRNSDITLTILIWREYYSSKIVTRPSDNEEYVKLQDLYELPREDNVKRHRANIQNKEFKFLPTSEEVARQRKINMDRWHQAMAFNRYND